MTKTLYQEDSYLMVFDSAIKDIINGNEVILSETPFYPEGGGQPCDLGVLEINGTKYNVLSVRTAGGNVYHRVDHEIPKEFVGVSVLCRLDAARRFYHMRHHTALHLLNSFMFKEFGVLVTGGQVGTPGESSRHDFEMEKGLTPEERKKCEDWINTVISEKRPVTAKYFTEEQANQIPGFRRTRNAAIPYGSIRGIEIESLDCQACGGTHVRNTGELGQFRIQKVDNKGTKLRRIKIMLD